ncbi:MAG: ABC transporter permease subunit [Deltaproteobacteria bacterium]|nr:ABC transporter permease subunit [Deltaproteobacteria bacterium]
MINSTVAIAVNTFREARRSRIFYSALVFALVMIFASSFSSEFTIATFDRVLRDAGTGAIDFFGALLAVFLGVGLVSRDIDRRTAYSVVAKPIHRWQFVVGKFIGLQAVLLVALGAMFALFLAIAALWSDDPPPYGTLFWYFALRLSALSLVVAIAVLFSTFSGTAVAAFGTLSLLVAGHLSEEFVRTSRFAESALTQWFAEAFYLLLPNFSRFGRSYEVAYGVAVEAGPAITAMLYSAAYSLALLILASVIFARRELR